LLERIDLSRDLHFQTKTTIDTLDYSGEGWNEGSKVVVACCGAPKRTLKAELPANFKLPIGYSNPQFVQKGILAIQSPAYNDRKAALVDIERLKSALAAADFKHIPMIILTEDATFLTQTLNNFVWVTFTRSNPSIDIHGLNSFIENKHWGCTSLLIDARVKPHHAPPLIEDKKTAKNVDKLFSKGGPLYGSI
jgi:4-hydroxy-3-polyprenylbenzoate decarboxylase